MGLPCKIPEGIAGQVREGILFRISEGTPGSIFESTAGEILEGIREKISERISGEMFEEILKQFQQHSKEFPKQILQKKCLRLSWRNF